MYLKIKEFFRRMIIVLADRSGEGDLKIPKYVLESLARCFLPSILSFFESEEGKQEFEEWKKQQELKKRQKPIKTE